MKIMKPRRAPKNAHKERIQVFVYHFQEREQSIGLGDADQRKEAPLHGHGSKYS